MTEVKQFPRPVAVHSHQFYIEGIMHKFTERMVGGCLKACALVEDRNGAVKEFALDNYWIEFKDR